MKSILKSTQLSWSSLSSFALVPSPSPFRAAILKILKKEQPSLSISLPAMLIVEDLCYWSIHSLIVVASKLPPPLTLPVECRPASAVVPFPSYLAGRFAGGCGFDGGGANRAVAGQPLSSVSIVRHDPFPNDEFHVLLRLLRDGGPPHPDNLSGGGDGELGYYVLTRSDLLSLGLKRLVDDFTALDSRQSDPPPRPEEGSTPESKRGVVGGVRRKSSFLGLGGTPPFVKKGDDAEQQQQVKKQAASSATAAAAATITGNHLDYGSTATSSNRKKVFDDFQQACANSLLTRDVSVTVPPPPPDQFTLLRPPPLDINSRDVTTAVRTFFKGELSKLALRECTKVLTMHLSSSLDKGAGCESVPCPSALLDQLSLLRGGAGAGGGSINFGLPASVLQMPVAAAATEAAIMAGRCLTTGGSVVLAKALDVMLADLLAACGKAAIKNCGRIARKHVMMAISQSDSLNKMFGHPSTAISGKELHFLYSLKNEFTRYLQEVLLEQLEKNPKTDASEWYSARDMLSASSSAAGSSAPDPRVSYFRVPPSLTVSPSEGAGGSSAAAAAASTGWSVRGAWCEAFVGMQVRRADDRSLVGVIRYIGGVATSKDVEAPYLGVEWDDDTRGKNDGSVVVDSKTGETVRYFQARAPTAGSFCKAHVVEPVLDGAGRRQGCGERVVLSGNIESLDHWCFARLLAKAGIYGYSEALLETYRKAASETLSSYLTSILTVADHRRSGTIDALAALSGAQSLLGGGSPLFGFGQMRAVLGGGSARMPPAGFLTSHDEWVAVAMIEREEEERREAGGVQPLEEEEDDDDDDTDDTSNVGEETATQQNEEPHRKATRQLIANESSGFRPVLSYNRFQSYVREVAQDLSIDLNFEPLAFQIIYMYWERDMIVKVRDTFKMSCVELLHKKSGWEEQQAALIQNARELASTTATVVVTAAQLAVDYLTSLALHLQTGRFENIRTSLGTLRGTFASAAYEIDRAASAGLADGTQNDAYKAFRAQTGVNECRVAAREELRQTFVVVEKRLLFYEVVVAENDIMLAIFLRTQGEGGAIEEKIVEEKRYASGAIHKGSIEAGDGLKVFVFVISNIYSRLRPKTVLYRLSVVDTATQA